MGKYQIHVPKYQIHQLKYKNTIPYTKFIKRERNLCWIIHHTLIVGGFDTANWAVSPSTAGHESFGLQDWIIHAIIVHPGAGLRKFCTEPAVVSIKICQCMKQRAELTAQN